MIRELQNNILEMIARGETLLATIEQLCKKVESIASGLVCSVVTVEQDRLHHLAGPSLPAQYARMIDNLAIGPNKGSCGTAAYLEEPVIVTDIETDRRWAAFKHLVTPLGFKACWSTPIKSGSKVVATFAFYYRESRGPNELEHQIVEACVHLCAIAIERDARVRERERLTYTDALTGLPNRFLFHRILAAFKDRSQDWGILLLDVDNLKYVNDTFGHAAGDELIKSVATRTSEIAGIRNTFRLGGDEFAIIIHSQDRGLDLAAQAQDILNGIENATECAGHVVFPRATIGGADSRKSYTPDQTLKNADIALYHAKDSNRGHYVEFSPTLGTAITRRSRAIREVGLALREDRMHAYYQPIVRLDTREVVGFEALCRMRNGSGEIISAANFHEATKDYQVASELTHFMLLQVAHDASRWLEKGLPLQHVGVNVAAADLYGGRLNDRICKIFSDVGVPLSHIILEITESVYFDKRGHDIADQIRQLRSTGLRVALDDFGTGYASLTHLLTVPVDIIKIDKSFIDRLRPNDPAVFIVEGVLDIARKLGIRVVAEGIEKETQALQLQQLGCALGQGYLFSKAVDHEAAARLLQQSAQPLPVLPHLQLG